jgi:hypothetical protein
MRRFFWLLLLLLVSRAPLPAQSANQSTLGWRLAPVSSLHKLTAKNHGQLENVPYEPAQLMAARGEWESFQIVITAGDQPLQIEKIAATGLATHLAHFLPSSNVQLYWENFVYVDKPSGNRRVERLWWPDALIPLHLQAKKTIAPHRSEVLWAAVQVPPDAEPGEYFGEIDIETNQGAKALAVVLQVAPVRMPVPTLRGNVAVYYDVLRDWYAKNWRALTDAEFAEQKTKYFDFLLDYRVNAYDLPVDWQSKAASAYLTNHKVLSVRLPPLDQPDFNTAVEKLRNTNTLHKAYYYWIDEPPPQRYAEVLSTTQKLHQIEPLLKHLVTIHPNQALKNAVDIWCPNVGDYFGLGFIDFAALAQERQRGRETWWYTMVEPKHPYPTWLLDDDASAVRVYGWLMAHYNINGFVYSMAHGWGPKPLEDLQSFAGTNGDGTLLYPSEIVGGSGPMPSIRLMLLRDSIEDYELLSASDPKLRRQLLQEGLFASAKTNTLFKTQGNVYEWRNAQQGLESSLSEYRQKLLQIAPLASIPKAALSQSQRAALNKLSIASINKQIKVPQRKVPQRTPRVDGKIKADEWPTQPTRVELAFHPSAHEWNRQTPTSLFWSHESKHLYVAMRARNSAKVLSGEWVGVELSPQNANEKWRFVVTAKGNAVVEKHTREGHFRIEGVQWKSATKTFSGYYDVEMQIPLEVLGNAQKFRLTALRRAWDDKLAMNHLLRAWTDAGDPRLMTLIELQNPSSSKKQSSTPQSTSRQRVRSKNI